MLLLKYLLHNSAACLSFITLPFIRNVSTAQLIYCGIKNIKYDAWICRSIGEPTAVANALEGTDDLLLYDCHNFINDNHVRLFIYFAFKTCPLRAVTKYFQTIINNDYYWDELLCK